jgi:predicted RNA methylase
MSEGVLAATQVATAELASAPACPEDALLLEHDPVPFPNYPYEWAPEMLHAAGALTLDFASSALEGGFELKDATPYNVMYCGARPVFLDVNSFSPRNPLDMLWRPYAQFVRTFVYPLLAVRHFGLRLDELLLVHRDGLEPERMLRLCSWWRRWMPPFLGSVTAPALMSRGGRDADRAFAPRLARDEREALFLIRRTLRRAQRLLSRAAVPGIENATTRYMTSGHTYTADQLAIKTRFVQDALSRIRPKRVLDIGCNTGHFSLVAAGAGASVVAIDRSPETIGAVWRAATAQNFDILPLVVDIARPPWGCGWANRECRAFLDRAAGAFDCVLMLAVMHHLVVNERVPFPMLFEFAAGLTTRALVAEYVDPSDSQFRMLARGRDVLYGQVTRSTFEDAAARWFRVMDSTDITPTRRLYLLEKDSA